MVRDTPVRSAWRVCKEYVMSQNEERISTTTPYEAEPIPWRTPGRKLTKEDLSATSALILGCTTQCCDGCSGAETILTDIGPGS